MRLRLWYPKAHMVANPLRKLCWMGLLLAGLGCGDDRLRGESRAFLRLYEVIDHRQPAQIRELKLAPLGWLVLTEPDVKKARDECVAAHRALLRPEREQRKAA